MSSYKAGLADPLPAAVWLNNGRGGHVAFAAYPAPRPWLHLLISHGYGEHMGWYDHVARTLQAQGVSAYLFDHYHHGRSSGRPADVPDYAELVDGLRLVLHEGVQPQRQPGTPLALLGHSNGGLVAVLTVAALPKGTFDALVLCSPFLGFPPGLQRAMLPLVNLLGLLIPRYRLPLNGLPQLRTSDRSIWPEYERDPLRFRGLSVRFVRAMMRALAQAWRAPSCQGLPLLLAFGDKDHVVDLPAALRWFEQVESPDKALRPYPGLRHELFQEAAWRDVLQDVSDWLHARLSQAPRREASRDAPASGGIVAVQADVQAQINAPALGPLETPATPQPSPAQSRSVRPQMPTIAFTMIGHNEAHNLPRSLSSVQWADKLIYVDCASTDGSAEVARRYTPHVFTRPNVSNLNVNKAFGIEQADTDWVFYLDADEVLGPKLAQEIRDTIAADPTEAAFDMPRRNHFFGAWVRHGGHYPDPQLRLFRRGRARFALQHVHEKLQVDGGVGHLRHPMEHFTVDSALTAIRKMDFNSSFNAMDMVRRGQRPTAGMALRYLFWKPLSRFVRRYGFKGGFLDGWPGLLVAVIDCIDFPFRFIKFWYWATHPEDRPEPGGEQATP